MKKISVFLLVIFINSFCVLHAQWVQTKVSGGGGIYSFTFNETNIFASSFGSGVYRSTDNGTNWTESNTGLTDKVVSHVTIIGTNLFAGTMNSGAFRSTDNGANWNQVNSGLTNTDVRSFAVNGTNLFAGTHGGVFISTDSGMTWTAAGSFTDYVFSLISRGANLFAGVGGSSAAGNGVFLSTNNGTNWTAVNTGLTSKDVRFLAVSGANLFACTNDSGIFRSIDNGTSWSAVNNGLPKTWVNAFAINETNLFAGTGEGVFLSTDNGANWTAVNSGLTEKYIGSLAVIGMNLFAGTGGIWRRPLSEMITDVNDKQNNLPSDFAIQQNYPNPFNPSTTINYSVPLTSIVNISIYDMLGREIEKLVNEEKLPGNYLVKFDGSSFSSGIYFYRLQSGNYSKTKKLLLIK